MSTLEWTTTQTRCRHIGACIINTDICWNLHECLWIALLHQSMAQYKLDIVYKTWQLKHEGGFPIPCCSTHVNLSIDVSITNVGLILTKLGWFQHFGTSQKTQFRHFLKRKSNVGVFMLQYSWRPFHWCINYYCRTDIDEAKVIFFLDFGTSYKSKVQFRLF